MKKLIAFIALASAAAADDTVHLKGGVSMKGKLRFDGDRAIFSPAEGGTAQLSIDQIERIAWDKDSPEPARLRQQYAEMKGEPPERARWCTKFGLEAEARRAWARVLEADPENKEALRALGRGKAAPKKETPKAAPEKKKGGPVVKSGPDPWKEIDGGLTLRTEHFELRGDLGREKLLPLADLAEKMNAFHREHFANDIGKEWKITLFRKEADFVAYSKTIGSDQYGGGGYCDWDRKEFVGHGEAGHSYEALVKHELGHAYYKCPGPFWLREGAAVLVEALEWEGGKPVIKVNAPRLTEIKAYWAEGKHRDLRCCTLKPVFPIAYAHHWSFHYYVWVKKGPEFYRKMLKDLENTKESDDLTDRVAKMLGMPLEALERDWKSFIDNLK